MIAVINYNRESSELLKRTFAAMDISEEIKITDAEDEICNSDKIILPDTSNIKLTLRWMQFHNLYNLFRVLNKPILGISAGAAMMCDSISGINGLCLRFFPVPAVCTQKSGYEDHKQTGIQVVADTKLLSNINNDGKFHFNNDCTIVVNDSTSSKMIMDEKEFAATLEKSDYYGIMFDPSESGEEGKTILNNFVNM